MKVYWQHGKSRQRLIITDDNGDHEEEIGGVRETRQGFDGFAKPFGYDLGRGEKGFATMEDAKRFVESHRPWEHFDGTEGLEVDQEVRPEAS